MYYRSKWNTIFIILIINKKVNFTVKDTIIILRDLYPIYSLTKTPCCISHLCKTLHLSMKSNNNKKCVK